MAADRAQAERLLFELDYWRAAIEEVRVLTDTLADTASTLMRAPVDLLELMLTSGLTIDAAEGAARVSGTVGDALEQLRAMQQPVQRLIDLITGRIIALDREADDVRDDEGEPS